MLIENKIVRDRRFIFSWLGVFFVVVIVLGVFFRFVNIDTKVYWFDEAATTNRILGLTDRLIGSAGQILTIEDVHRFLKVDGFINTFNRAIDGGKMEPQLPPLYYIMLQGWMQVFGSSVAAIRSMSAVISLLAFPCIYWLCLELFQSSFVGLIAVALIAISPMQVLYAQEARMYSLLAIAVLLSSAALLRAMRVKTKLSWMIYSATLLVGLYTHIIFFLVVIGHGIYVVTIEIFRLSKVLVSYLISLLLGLLGFLPWLFILVKYFDKAHSSLDWMTKDISRFGVCKYWIINLSRMFLDIIPIYDLKANFSSFNHPLIITAIAIIISLIGYSIYFIYRHTSRRIWLFCLTSIGVTSISLALPDIILGGYRSYHIKYLTASYLGIYLTLAYLLATKISSTNIRQQKIWQIATIFLISCGLLSNIVIYPAQTWWNKSFSSEILPISKIINQTNSPLVIIENHWWSTGNFGSLSTLLKPKVAIQLAANPTQIKLPKNSNIYLFSPSEELQKQLAAEHKLKLSQLYKKQLSLWKIEKNSSPQTNKPS